MRQHFHRQTCYCPRHGSLSERSDNEDLFNSVNSILGAISGVITVFNFVQGRRRKKRSHNNNNEFALQTCYVPEFSAFFEGLFSISQKCTDKSQNVENYLVPLNEISK